MSFLLSSLKEERFVHSLRSFVVKGNIAVKGEEVSLGLREPVEIATADAEIVSFLEAKGWSLAGRAHLSELGLEASGRNSFLETLLHPQDPAKLVLGSASGSAVAVAKGYSQLGVGTDFGGSVRMPALECGCFGYRAKADSFPRGGTQFFDESMDAFGFTFSRLSDFKALFELGDDASDIKILVAGVPSSMFLEPAAEAFYQKLCKTTGFELFDLEPQLKFCEEARAALALSALKPKLESLLPLAGAELESQVRAMLSAAELRTESELTELRARQLAMKEGLDRVLSDNLLLLPAYSGSFPFAHDCRSWELNPNLFRFMIPANLFDLDSFVVPCAPYGFQLLMGPDKRSAALHFLAGCSEFGLKLPS